MSEYQENPRISLDEAANMMSMIIDEIEALETDDESEIIEKYMTFGTSLTNSIDRRKYLLKEAESKIELAKKMKEDLDFQIKKYRKVHESVIESTKKIVEEHPSIVFRDSFGKKVFIQPNPAPRLICNIETKTTTYHNTLCEYDRSYLFGNGYGKYVVPVTINVLDTNRIKEDIISGVEDLPFASVVKGTQLRGMK